MSRSLSHSLMYVPSFVLSICIKLQFIDSVNGDMQKVPHLKQQKS